MTGIESFATEKLSETSRNSFNPDKLSDRNFDFKGSSDGISLNEMSDKKYDYHKDNKTFDSDKLSDNKFDYSQPKTVESGETKTPDAKNGVMENEKISYEIHTRNESLDGDRHPITGVPFERKTVEDSEGNEVTGVFPEFDSDFDAQLPEDLYEASDKEQFAECNKQLKEAVEKDPELAKKFTPEQLEQIKNGETPDGYTWHHNEEKGKMQLVDSETHAKTGHTGGRSIWGGGNENR